MDELYQLESMGETAENIFEMSCAGRIAGGEISREEQDRFALQNHQRAVNAINLGYFKREIVPVAIPRAKKDALIVDTVEHPRYQKTDNGYELATRMEKLAAFRLTFREGDTLTAVHL